MSIADNNESIINHGLDAIGAGAPLFRDGAGGNALEPSDTYEPGIFDPETVDDASDTDYAFEVVDTDADQAAEESRVSGKLMAKTVVGLAGLSLVFEQSPLNEALRTNIAFDVLSHTQSAIAVGTTVAALTAAIEFGSSSLISLGLHAEGGAVQKLKERMAPKNKEAVETAVEAEREKPAEEEKASALGKIASIGADAGLALGIGAGLVTVKHHIADAEPTLRKDLVTSAKATGVVAGVSGTIGWLVGGGINYTNDTILEVPAEYFVDYATDTRFWVGVLGIGYAIKYGRRAVRSLQERRETRKGRNAQSIEDFTAQYSTETN